MSFLSIFKNSPEKKIAKARKRVKEPHGDASVRVAACQTLAAMGTSEAIEALLDRFKITVAPATQDESEKEQVFQWLVSCDVKSVHPLSRFLRAERQVYWPVKALRAILAEEEFIDSMEKTLAHLQENPPASPETQAQMIRVIEDLHSSGLEEIITGHLRERDDDICLASIDYLVQHAGDQTRKTILECYLDSQDRPRIKAHLLDCLSEKGWVVRGFRAAVEKTLPAEYVLTRDGRIRRIGGR
jgi:HEAT repeat protein